MVTFGETDAVQFGRANPTGATKIPFGTLNDETVSEIETIPQPRLTHMDVYAKVMSTYPEDDRFYKGLFPRYDLTNFPRTASFILPAMYVYVSHSLRSLTQPEEYQFSESELLALQNHWVI